MKKILLIALLCFVIGALTALVGFFYYGLQAEEAFLRRSRDIIVGQQQAFFQGNQLLYGTVTSVDPIHRTITATFDQQFASPTNPTTLQLLVATDAYIASQNLIEKNGVYVGLSKPEVRPLSDIQTGDHIAIISIKGLGNTIAVSILFGDPL